MDCRMHTSIFGTQETTGICTSTSEATVQLRFRAGHGSYLGAVLSQIIAGQERVVAYASKTLAKTERKYRATCHEMLALVWATHHFRLYLYGCRFVLCTDHSALQWLHSFKEPEGQVARWLEQLAEYDYQVVHRPGRNHISADCLSCVPCKQCGFSEALA